MIIKRSFLVVGNSLNQTRSIVKYLKLNYPYASVKQIFTEVSLREHTKKNISNLGFILLALRVMCFGENSLLGYSFWHNAFQQKKSNSFLMRFIYILIANFARRFPLFSYDIRRFIELLYIRSKSSIKGFNYDAVFFYRDYEHSNRD